MAFNRQSPLYFRWVAMRQRCSNQQAHDYPNYGGRGIKVCARWETFTNFLEDVGLPKNGMTLDRINNNGDYKPSNVRWITVREQNRNSRRNINIAFNDETMPMKDWANRIGISTNSIKLRLKAWPLKEALTQPPMQGKPLSHRSRTP